MPLCPKDVVFGDPLLDDFRNFLDHVLFRLKGVHPSPNQFEMADWIWRGGVMDHLKHPEDIPDKRMAEALRGVGKSTITHIYIPWEVRRAYEYTEGKPDCHVMIVSGTKDLADAAARFIRDLMETVPILQCLVPEDRDEKWSGTTMNVRGKQPALAPTIFARGLFGRMTGDRADLLAFDDIEIPQNAETQGQREKLRTRSQEFVDVLTPGGEMVGLGTPQVEDTVYNEIEEWGFLRRKWPARFPDPTWMAKHGHMLSPRLARKLSEDPSLEGKPTEPRFTEEVLMKREMVSRSRFALQNMLDTSMSDEDRYPLKLRDLCIMDLEEFKGPERISWSNDERRRMQGLPCVGLTGDHFYGPRELDVPFAAYDYRILAVDPSGRGADETAYVVLGAIGGNLYLLEVKGIQGGYAPHVLSQITHAARKFKVQTIVTEDNYGDGMFDALLSAALRDRVAEEKEEKGEAAWHGAAIEGVHHIANKELRIIDTLEPVMNQHRLAISTSVVKNDRPGRGDASETYRLFHQMSRIQRVKGALAHYDRLDALAIGVAHLTQRMALQGDSAADRRAKAEEKQMWSDFWENHRSSNPKPVKDDRANRAVTGKRRLLIGRGRRKKRVSGSYTSPFLR